MVRGVWAGASAKIHPRAQVMVGRDSRPCCHDAAGRQPRAAADRAHEARAGFAASRSASGRRAVHRQRVGPAHAMGSGGGWQIIVAHVAGTVKKCRTSDLRPIIMCLSAACAPSDPAAPAPLPAVTNAPKRDTRCGLGYSTRGVAACALGPGRDCRDPGLPERNAQQQAATS